ncbi:MAG: cupin domain-containing protein [Candidatus Omnitrophica bacterium]|nr:cupin domain-containing protein [Candidatus Omnitrophota bacterium]
MPIFIKEPTQIKAVGNKPKIIKEYIGRVNSKTNAVSIAYMNSPLGWIEPGQKPEFDEYTLVVKGILTVRSEDQSEIKVTAGQAIICPRGEWVQYSTPDEGAEYVAVCLPAFSLDLVHRDT